MSKIIVKIPNVSEEARIGISFNHMIKVIAETKACDEVQWDFADVNFLHPFFLAPLAIYKNTSGKIIECVNMSLQIQSYLNSIFFDRMLHFGAETRENVEQVLHFYSDDKTYLPLCSFAMTDSNKDIFGSVLKNVIMKQANYDKSANSSLSYLISELLDNVYEHSQSENGYVFSQYLKREGAICLCIADSGITIPGSFKNAGLYQMEINGNDAEALKLANDGYSTKNLPHAENRGYGISTTKKMLVKGMKGGFFMLSGGAFHRFDNKTNDYINLNDVFRWSGTIILMRIPVILPDTFNLYDYVES